MKIGNLFYYNEGDIRERNQVLRKMTMLSHKHWTLVQLTIFKVCFHLIVELVSPDDITLSLLGIISVGLPTGHLLERQSCRLRNGVGPT